MKKNLSITLLLIGSLQILSAYGAQSAQTIHTTTQQTVAAFSGTGHQLGTAQPQAPQTESGTWSWAKKLVTMALGSYPGMIASVKAAEAVCRMTGRSTIPYAHYVRAAGALAGVYAGYHVHTYGIWQSIKDVTTIINNPYVFPAAVTAGAAYAGSLLTPTIAEKALNLIAVDIDKKYITLLTQSGALVAGGLSLYVTTFYKLHSKINDLLKNQAEIQAKLTKLQNTVDTNHTETKQAITKLQNTGNTTLQEVLTLKKDFQSMEYRLYVQASNNVSLVLSDNKDLRNQFEKIAKQQTDITQNIQLLVNHLKQNTPLKKRSFSKKKQPQQVILEAARKHDDDYHCDLSLESDDDTLTTSSASNGATQSIQQSAAMHSLSSINSVAPQQMASNTPLSTSHQQVSPTLNNIDTSPTSIQDKEYLRDLLYSSFGNY